MMWLIQGLAFLATSAFLKPLLTRALIALGFSVVTYVGVSIGTAALTSNIATQWAGIPADIVAVLTIMKIPNAFNVILSAYVGALGIRGLTAAGSLKRAVWRPGQTGDLFGVG